MTGVRDCWIVCDVCERASAIAGEYPASTIAAAREHAVRFGWHSSSGRDVCPDCWKEGKR